MMMRKICVLFGFLIAALCVRAQKVSDAEFEQVGRQVRITYRLTRTTDIQVFLSTDGGKTFGQPLKAVTGDVGKDITPGSKTILWSPLDEMERLVSDRVVFKVVPAASKGVLPGRFSVSKTKQVQFAKGNLQYQASTGTWRFAEHQWDIVGIGYGQTSSSYHCYIGGQVMGGDNRQINSTYRGWIDLFGWGTGNMPTKSSTNATDYTTFTDWGVKKIINGGNKPNQWYTLSKDEFVYLFSIRPNADSKYGAAKVNGVTGIVILPDEWTLPSGCGFISGMTSASEWYDWSLVASMNIYNADQWQQMEMNGAVFLPCSGSRYGLSVSCVGTRGNYWSSSTYSGIYAFSLYFCSGNLLTESYYYRGYGFSVRLVTDS